MHAWRPMASAALFLAALLLPGAPAPGAPAEAVLTPPVYWASDLGAPPRILMAARLSAGQPAALLSLDPSSGDLQAAPTSALEKPESPFTCAAGLAKGALAAAAGPFQGLAAGAEVAALMPDGTVKLARRWNPAGRKFDGADTIRIGARLRGPALACGAPGPGNQCRLAFIDASGWLRVVALDATPARVLTVCKAPGAVRMAAAELSGQPALVWIDRRGDVYAVGLGTGPDSHPAPRLLLHAAPGSGLAAGHFGSATETDVVAGQELIPDGDPARAETLSSLPDAKTQSQDGPWLAAPLLGHSEDDLVRVHPSAYPFAGSDVLVQLASADAGAYSTAGDGLPDDWKTGKCKPGGLDLAALGCSPMHKAVIVEVQPIADVDPKLLHADIERDIQYYSKLPVKNPDGKPGIDLRILFLNPVAVKDAGAWYDMAAKYHAAAHQGVTHYMVVYNGGGGQSGQMADAGGCGAHPLYATFLHEFGHQLGLDHTGHYQPNWCPTYPSLMNYAYSYQLNGDPNAVGYSDGRLAGVLLREADLSEVLPLPIDKVRFLAGPPYHYRLKPGPDGKTTLIDWNWNGVFGEKHLRADINYGYSTNGGDRNVSGKAYNAPCLLTYDVGGQQRLLCVEGVLQDGALKPPSTLDAPHPSLAPDNPGRLLLRAWTGKQRDKEGASWTAGQEIAAGVTGDASAAWWNGAGWVAYPTASGTRLVSFTLDTGHSPGSPPNADGGWPQTTSTTPQPVPSPWPTSPSQRQKEAAPPGARSHGSESNTVTATMSAPLDVPDTAGDQVTLAPANGRMALFIWRKPGAPVGVRWLTDRNGRPELSAEQQAPFSSELPVGAAAGGRARQGQSLWVVSAQTQDAGRPRRWQVRHEVITATGALHELGWEWIGGPNGGMRGRCRPVVLWQANRFLGPDGQLSVFYTGDFSDKSPIACCYVATRIADKTVNGGWLERRYYDEWTQSRSGPAACFFRDDIALACRWFGNVHGDEDNNLFFAFHGSGIEKQPMGDFDDIAFISEVGLSHSIPYVAP